MSYIGNTNTTQGFTPAVDYFSGNGSTVAFTLSRPVASVAQVQANISNVPQNPSSAFSVSGNTITFTSAPPSGTNNIYVYYTSPITQVIAPGQGTVTSSSFGTITDFTTTGNTVLGDASTDTLNVGNGGLVKDASGNVGIGTASPGSSKLFVETTGTLASSFNSTAANGGYMTWRTNGTVIADLGTQINCFGTGDTDTFAINGRGARALLLGTNNTERVRISSGGQVTLANQPRFFAYGASGASGTSANYWIFPTAVVNTGSHYNTSTGIFTAPIAGVYKFTWSNIGNTIVDTYRYYIRIDNVDVSSSFQLRLETAVAGKYPPSASVTYMTALSQGQTVRIYFVSDGSNASYSSGSYPWFTGELIG